MASTHVTLILLLYMTFTFFSCRDHYRLRNWKRLFLNGTVSASKKKFLRSWIVILPIAAFIDSFLLFLFHDTSALFLVICFIAFFQKIIFLSDSFDEWRALPRTGS